MFERFMICIVSFHIVCLLRYTTSGVHPAPIPFYHLRSNLTFGQILPRIIEQVLCPRYSTFLSFLLHSISFHIMMFERFMNYIVPFHIVCLLRYTTSCTQSCIHPVLILHSSFLYPGVYPLCMSCVCPVYVLSTSDIHPACIRRASGVQSFLSSSVKSYLRSYLTADYRTSLVPAIFHFFILFITFIY